MTVWKAGMLAAVVRTDWCLVDGSRVKHEAEMGDVFAVRQVRSKRIRRPFGGWVNRLIGRRYQLLLIDGYGETWSGFFRPVNDAANDAELIARIKNCEPAVRKHPPARVTQSHSSHCAPPAHAAGTAAVSQTIGSGPEDSSPDAKLIPDTGGFAAAGDAAVSNTELGASLQRTTRSHELAAVTHRDLSQHADNSFTDLNCFAPFHEDAS